MADGVNARGADGTGSAGGGGRTGRSDEDAARAPGGAPPGAPGSRRGGPANVLVLLTDQQRWDTTGVHGNPLGLTPAFDRMAAEGVHVANSFTCQPVCAPSRAALQTGRYPAQTGVYRNNIPLPEDAPTLAHHFARAGYDTGYIGKWHLADTDVAGPVRPAQRGGYRDWLAANLLEFTSDAYETTLYDGDGRPHELAGYRADALTDAAIDYITRERANPFFLFLSYLEPHHQNQRDDYPAPQGYGERYAGGWTPGDLAALGGNAAEHLGGYYGMVRRLDECLGRVLAALEEHGLAEDTVVLYTSDHGCHFKTRNSEYKRSCHDASIRVPTALRGPGLATGRPITRLVSHVDLPPTLLDAAGLPVPPDMHGRSLLPLVCGGADDRPDDVLVQISESQVGRALRTPRWKYGVVAPDADGWDDPAADEYVDAYLYDLESDPHELDNLVTAPGAQEVIAPLRDRLLARLAETGERPVIRPAR
ncbi:sulfatase-like hydrolase/transferase [Streptomonospora nanhaiensis]|uniref:sulfatase-like hydrolase/transferase n=1 Tax=Streptomonospora nanhaiensis TaxID=1323731 RepID=UPI001C392FE3|nr:sulfatase-like hydrolase/transferase [Streptomonospora nanhaiensis]MBV2366677.1 sulfatase-like hydrolase/transferase [Streptomonospora nanhaiensis]